MVHAWLVLTFSACDRHRLRAATPETILQGLGLGLGFGSRLGLRLGLGMRLGFGLGSGRDDLAEDAGDGAEH